MDASNVVLSIEQETLLANCEEIEACAFVGRRCVKFSRMEGSDVCRGCKEIRENGFHTSELNEGLDWDSRNCTTEASTSHGQICFINSPYRKIAKFIRVDPETSPEILENYIFNPKGFGINKESSPKLLISVTGGARKFKINSRIKDAFKKGLLGAALDANAWIFSGGSNCGVMRLIGESAAENIANYNLTLFGFVMWGCLNDREKLNVNGVRGEPIPYFLNPESEDYDNQYKFQLNPNHTNFILVDDGSKDRFGKELEFRQRFENYLSMSLKIPKILIVIEGGFTTLKSIVKSIRARTPLIIIAGTEGCADLVIKILMLPKIPKKLEKILQKYIKLKSQENLSPAVEYLQIVWKNRKLFHIFKNKENFCDIKQTILGAVEHFFRQSKVTKAKFVELSIRLNRYKSIKKLRAIMHGLSLADLESLLELALIENRLVFVYLILEAGINLKSFLTQSRLKKLYWFSRKSFSTQPFCEYLDISKKDNNLDMNDILEWVLAFMRKIFSSFMIDMTINDIPIKSEFHLFLWSVLTNHLQLAKLFWKLGKNQISNALIAARIYRFFAKRNKEIDEEMKIIADEFEDLSIEVLNIFENNSRDLLADILILRNVDVLGFDCLALARKSKCERFIGHQVVQKTIDNLWSGEVYSEKIYTERETALRRAQMQEYVLPNRSSFLNDENFLRLNAKKENKILVRLIFMFTNLKTRFLMKWAFYSIFLIIFSYTLLFRNKYQKIVELPTINLSSISLNGTIPTETKEQIKQAVIFYLDIPWNEIYLFICGIILLLGEIFQSYRVQRFKLKKATHRITKHLHSIWNLLDVFGCLFLLSGLILKYISVKMFQSRTLYLWSKIILSTDICIWFSRSLQYVQFFKAIGPKLVMIRKMIKDLMFFLLVILTFVLAFGIALESIVAPKETFDLSIISEILNTAYWPIYGQMNLLDRLNNNDCEKEPETCLDTISSGSSYVILMIYLIFANVLLLNLLIAVFSSTYDQIQERSDLIWKNQRLDFVCEYIGRHSNFLKNSFIKCGFVSKDILTSTTETCGSLDALEKSCAEQLKGFI